MPQVLMGVIVPVIPTERQVYTAIIKGIGVSSENAISPQPPRSKMKAQGIITLRGPNLSNQRPAKKPRIAPITAPGSITIPVSRAEMPRRFCR